MSGRTIILLVAGIIAAFTAVSVRNRLSQQQTVAEAPAVTARVLIAKRDLTPGNFIQSAQDMEWSNNAVDDAAGGPFLHEGAARIEDFNGAVVRRPLHAGDAIPASAVMKSGEGGFMSAVLDPGKRAVSIAVNATSGNAGFVSPGDKIDMIVTHRIKMHGENNSNGGGSTTEESVVSETFVRNVRVVAVDQMLDNPENKAILAKTVTVEVSPRQAEQIAVAAEMGKISVALRSLVSPENKVAGKEGDGQPVLTDLYGNPMNAAVDPKHDFTRDSDVSALLDRKSVMMPRIHVIRGDQQENLEFYQSGR